MKVADSNQMRELDRRAIEEFHVPALTLMENAALRVIDLLQTRFGPLRSKRVDVICGKGNNGGDGLAIARHLLNRFDSRVTVWLLAPGEELKDEGLSQFKMAKACGVDLRPASKIDLSQSNLVIDALFGTGIKGAVTGKPAEIIHAINQSRKPVVAVDVPSGLDTDSGRADGAVVQADLTVTFVLPKFGLMVYPGAGYVGELVIVDIGTPKIAIEESAIRIFSPETRDISSWLPKRTNGRDINKGTFGHVMIFSGSKGFAGAPVLVAEAAARTGAGLVTLIVPADLQNPVMCRISPVVMTTGLAQTASGTFSAAALDSALKLTETATAAAIGPGIGGGDEMTAFTRELVMRCPIPLVIDADALNLLSKEPDHGAGAIRTRKAATILTPHPGEMGRLLGCPTKAIEDDRKGAVMQAMDTFKCIVLLKGARTLIVSPEGRIYINTTGNAGMATGGAGDALTGVIAALLSQKLDPEKAAAVGAYIHGMAGDLAESEQGGATGLIATDLISMLPKSIAHCQSSGDIAQHFELRI